MSSDMPSDDDKQIPEPDPWAGLDLGGNAEDTSSDGNNEFTFSFSDVVSTRDDAIQAGEPAADNPFAEDPTAADEPVELPIGLGPLEEPDQDQDLQEAEDAGIPLVVFPPADAELDGSDVLIGTGRSGIIAVTDAAGDDTDSPPADELDADAFADGFDDEQLARELAMNDGNEPPPGLSEGLDEESLEEGREEWLQEGQEQAIAFPLEPNDGERPFAIDEQSPFGGDEAAWPQDVAASIPIAAGMAAGTAASAAMPVPAAGGVPSRKKGSGLGQVVGIVLGGLLALPITYAILIWGFQRDPFKFGKQMPQQLAFLLPQKLRPGYMPPKKSSAGPNLDKATSLDDLAAVASGKAGEDVAEETTAQPGDEPPAAAAREGSAASSERAEPTEPGEPTEPAAAGPASDAVVAVSGPVKMAEPADPSDAVKAAVSGIGAGAENGPDQDSPGKQESPGTLDSPVKIADPFAPAAEGTAAAVPAPMPAEGGAALPAVGPLSGLDDLLASSIPAPAAAAPMESVPAAEPPPLDLAPVDAAVERALQAIDALDQADQTTGPDRDRLLVGWYRRLAAVGEELVGLETVAAESGRPLSKAPESAAGLFERICGSDVALEELGRLGGMWLSKQKPRADGIMLVATVETSRRVGPYWTTHVLVAEGNDDGSDRSVAVVSRMAPPADSGDRVVVSGVMFDSDTIWAAEVRPVDHRETAATEDALPGLDAPAPGRESADF